MIFHLETLDDQTITLHPIADFRDILKKNVKCSLCPISISLFTGHVGTLDVHTKPEDISTVGVDNLGMNPTFLSQSSRQVSRTALLPLLKKVKTTEPHMWNIFTHTKPTQWL